MTETERKPDPVTTALLLDVFREYRKGKARRDELWLSERAWDLACCLSDLDGNGIIVLDDTGTHAPAYEGES